MMQKIDNSNIREEISCVIFDLDGTIYRGDRVIPGAADFVRGLMKNDIRVMFYTNRAYRTPAQISDKLKSMDFLVEEEQVVTSAVVTARALRGKRIFCIGEPALTGALISEGAVLTEENPDCVVLGFVETLDMDTLTRAVQFITHDQAMFVATNLDSYILVDGKRVAENGAIAAAIQKATGISPVVFGKPNSMGIEMIMKTFDLQKKEVLIIGDTLATDIQCGINAGIQTALILTGVTSVKEVSDNAADYVVETYDELCLKIWGHRILF